MKLITFSPTGTGFSVGFEIARAWTTEPGLISLFPSNTQHQSIKNDIAIIIVPVYSGRIPATAEASLLRITAQNTPVITAVMYGNRDYDDALLELNTLCKQQGFTVVASAAFIGTHSLDQSIAAHRPDFKDLTMAFNLGLTVKANLEEFKQREIHVKGQTPYKERKTFPYYPIAYDNCDTCGICAEKCPMNAISHSDPKATDPELCIACMLCARDCPQQARHLNMSQVQLEEFQKGLRAKCEGYKTPELFY